MAIAKSSPASAQETAATPPAAMPVTSPSTGAARRGSEVSSDESYRIGAGDKIDIMVTKNQILSRADVRVDNQGMINMPMVEQNIPAACRTERELAEMIRNHYLKFMYNPQVIVTVKEFNSQPVAVLGAVNSPGRFQLHRRVTLLELLTYVNGPSEKAGRSIQVVRTSSVAACDAKTRAVKPEAGSGDDEQSSEASRMTAYSLNDTMQATLAANPVLRSGDIVYVPEAEQAYVIGNVKSALTIPLKEPITLSEAIARAGGVTEDANTEKIRIARQVLGTQTKQEIIADLKAINRKQKQDIILQPNDIIDVPGPTGGRKFLQAFSKSLTSQLPVLPLRAIF